MFLHNPYHIFSHISAASVLVPFVLCIIKFKALNRTLRVLFIYLIISVLLEALSLRLTLRYIDNHAVQNTFTLLECLLLIFIYYLEFNTKHARRVIFIVACLFLTTAAIVFLGWKSYQSEDNIISTLESCLMIGLSVSFFRKLQKELRVSRLIDYYFFWINSAILIYFAAGFFLFLFDGYLENCDIEVFYILYSVHLLTNIIYNSLLTAGIWVIKAV